ncbi:hypothetical protein G4D82_02385 [Flavobacterium sp. CYK-4]|uniref:hypothetical protein n=1 Tax=Flavobacterium lotistagni TaxID=2709660 RepID=UPI00140DDC81|nr:hypothetical protein [Flavobacterium lotistagni]NHM06056.1 hypothetical protein [Flavobacterium lotistagni]
MEKGILFVLILLNTIVLMGQVWPDGAPPFARTVNIVFLVASFLYFSIMISKKKPKDNNDYMNKR